MRAWGFLKNRAVVASLGAVLIFGGGATFAALQMTHHAAPAAQANTANATATDTATTGSGAGAGATATTPPTATPIPPTPTTQQPTPASGAGQPFHQTGKVNSVSAGTNSFTMTVGSTTYTIVVVTSGTQKTEIQINGVAQSDLSNLATGMQTDVEGQWRSDGKILAFSVDAQSGGGGGGA